MVNNNNEVNSSKTFNLESILCLYSHGQDNDRNFKLKRSALSGVTGDSVQLLEPKHRSNFHWWQIVGFRVCLTIAFPLSWNNYENIRVHERDFNE